MINYSIVMRSVNANLFEINQAKSRIKAAQAAGEMPDDDDLALVETEKQNAFAVAQYTDVMTIEKFARHIATHGCVYSRADISAILYMAVDCMREMLLDGKKIRLGDLGDFSISLSSKGAESADKFTAQNITAAKVVWDAGAEFKNLMKDAEFNLVASRQAQAAILKAVKAGDGNPLAPHPSGISIKAINGVSYGESFAFKPNTQYIVFGTKLNELTGSNFSTSEGDINFKFSTNGDTIGYLSVDSANALSPQETTVTCAVEGEPIFMFKAYGA